MFEIETGSYSRAGHAARRHIRQAHGRQAPTVQVDNLSGLASWLAGWFSKTKQRFYFRAGIAAWRPFDKLMTGMRRPYIWDCLLDDVLRLDKDG